MTARFWTGDRPPRSELWLAFGLFVLWTGATWGLEGARLTFLRPEAAADRLVYAVVANLAVGTVGACLLLGRLIRRAPTPAAAFGFAPPGRTAAAVAAGSILGAALFLAQRPPTLDPRILLNLFSQVWVVSAAEVLVCWGVVGAVAARAAPGPRWASLALGVTVGALAFGVYHYAHSPPFNTVRMVALLTVVGVVSGAFFAIARDVYGTMVFHNFLGLYGVADAAARSGGLAAFETIRPPLVGMAAVSLLVLLVADRRLVRRATSRS